MNIEFYIEELVLHGFAPRDRYHIGAAVERELTRMFAEQGAPASMAHNREIANLEGGAFELAPDSKPQVIGNQVAQAVYGGLDR